MERNVGPSNFLNRDLNVSYVSIHRRSVVLAVLPLYILVYTHMFTKKTKNARIEITALLLKI